MWDWQNGGQGVGPGRRDGEWGEPGPYLSYPALSYSLLPWFLVDFMGFENWQKWSQDPPFAGTATLK